MSAEGRLGPGGVADLLATAWEQERTGILELETGGVGRKFVLIDGEIRYVTSPLPVEKLHVRLVSSGLVARQALIDASKDPDLRHALAAAGVLPAEAHDRELRSLIAGIVAQVACQVDGAFTLVDKTDLQLPGLLPDHDMIPVLWMAARQCPADFAARFLGDPAQRVTRSPGDDLLTRLPGLTPPEGFLLTRIDGYSSVNDLVRMSPIGAEETIKLLVAACCVGLVDVAGRPRVRLPKGSGKPGKRRPAAAASAKTMTTVVSTAGTIGGAAPAAPPRVEGAPSTWLAEADPGSIAAARDMTARTASADHYALLGVPPASDAATIRQAYYSLAKLYHPDRFGRDTDSSDREVVESLFARIGTAFDVLSDPETRRVYDERLKSGQLAAEQEQRDKKIDRKDIARESHEKGRALLASGDRARALQFLEHAAEADPDNYQYRMTLAAALMGDSRTRRRAERHLVDAIRIDSSKADAYYMLGVVYKGANLKSRALEQFRKGLSWDASHEGILKEMEEMGEGDGGEAGRLGGLFGKKK